MEPARTVRGRVVVVRGSSFFACLSVAIAEIVLKRGRFTGIGQTITMPLFFAFNALYPVELMPTLVQWLSRINPLSYEVSALLGIVTASGLLGRLTRRHPPWTSRA